MIHSISFAGHGCGRTMSNQIISLTIVKLAWTWIWIWLRLWLVTMLKVLRAMQERNSKSRPVMTLLQRRKQRDCCAIEWALLSVIGSPGLAIANFWAALPPPPLKWSTWCNGFSKLLSFKGLSQHDLELPITDKPANHQRADTFTASKEIPTHDIFTESISKRVKLQWSTLLQRP